MTNCSTFASAGKTSRICCTTTRGCAVTDEAIKSALMAAQESRKRLQGIEGGEVVVKVAENGMSVNDLGRRSGRGIGGSTRYLSAHARVRASPCFFQQLCEARRDRQERILQSHDPQAVVRVQ